MKITIKVQEGCEVDIQVEYSGRKEAEFVLGWSMRDFVERLQEWSTPRPPEPEEATTEEVK